MRTFSIGEQFLLDNEPFKIISGAIHYFRVVPEYWRDRLEKLKAMGCNTVETYMPWNLHEPKKGEYNFSGRCDIVRFLETAQSLGLHAIVRPGPYICAEWEFGGLPPWLLAEPDMHPRTAQKSFMDAMDAYIAQAMQRIAPLQIDKGGPVILLQVENEYGSFGDDSEYMDAVRAMLHKWGATVPLITSDGPDRDMLPCGTIKTAHPTVNFGSHAREKLDILENFLAKRGGGPLMVTEFWIGWFDAWGSEHHTTSAQDSARDLREILSRGSVNFYMFHGGTNFGFMNGANYYEKLTPDVASYDYDAPLSEDGEITPKYEAFRDVIAEFVPIPQVAFSTKIEKRAYGEFAVCGIAPLPGNLEALAKPVHNAYPLCMEKLGQNYGYTLYRTKITKGEKIEKFQLLGANDRAQIYLNDQHVMTLYDHELEKPTEVDWTIGEGIQLDILVENLGRVNYGRKMLYQRKGIDGGVLINDHFHFGWDHFSLLMEDMSALEYGQKPAEGPAFYKVDFSVDEPCDTFLSMEGWGKGFVLLNGENLGRFWDIGPQKRLYVPAPLLHKGENTLIVFESEGKAQNAVHFHNKPGLE